MIKLIAVIDSVRGMVDNPPDEIVAIIQKQLSKGNVLTLFEAFSDVSELQTVIETTAQSEAPVWVLGNATELELAFPFARELYLVQVDGIFDCKEFFPRFEDSYAMVKRKPIQQVGKLMYQCQLWQPDITHSGDSWGEDD